MVAFQPLLVYINLLNCTKFFVRLHAEHMQYKFSFVEAPRKFIIIAIINLRGLSTKLN